MNSSERTLPTVPRDLAGRWIAWNSTRTEIVASGLTIAEANQAALQKGESTPILAKAPRVDVRFLGGVR